MNSSESSQPLDEFGALNSQLTNMRIKKLLQIADNIRNDNEVVITATRSSLDSDFDVASKDLKSQEMNIDFGPNSEGGKYLASATSLSARLPAFDHVCHQDMAYMKIKSDEFVFASSAANENDRDSSIVIIPTDDPRIKAIIIPN